MHSTDHNVSIAMNYPFTSGGITYAQIYTLDSNGYHLQGVPSTLASQQAIVNHGRIDFNVWTLTVPTSIPRWGHCDVVAQPAGNARLDWHPN